MTKLPSKFNFFTGLNVSNLWFSLVFFFRIFRLINIDGFYLCLLVLHIEKLLDNFFNRHDLFSNYFNFFVVVLFDDFVLLDDNFLWDLNNFDDLNFLFNCVGHVDDLFDNLFVYLFNVFVTFVFDNLFLFMNNFIGYFLLYINFFIDWSFNNLFNNNFFNDFVVLFTCWYVNHYLMMLLSMVLILETHFPLNEQV